MGTGDEGEQVKVEKRDLSLLPFWEKVRITVLMCWAGFSCFAVFVTIIGLREKQVTQRLGHPLGKGDELFPPLVNLCVVLLIGLYATLIMTMPVWWYVTKPLKLSPRMRLYIDVAFVVFSFGLAYYYYGNSSSKDDADVWAVLLGFATCQHLMPMFNLLTCFDNFTALDVALALLVQAAALVSCVYAPPFVAALASIKLLLLRTSYYIKHQQQQQQLQLSDSDDNSIV